MLNDINIVIENKIIDYQDHKIEHNLTDVTLDSQLIPENDSKKK